MQFNNYTNNATTFKWEGSLLESIQNQKFNGRKIHSNVILDISGSMGELINGTKNKLDIVVDSLKLYLEFAKVLVNSGVQMKMTIVTFSTRTEVFYKSENNMSIQDIDKLIQGLDSLQPTASTVMAPAINEVFKNVDESYKNTFVIMTDGYADDTSYLMKNDIFKGKMHGALGIGSAKNYQEELLNYLASKETTYGGFNAEELKRGIIGFLLSDLMCVATEIEVRFPPGIQVFSSEVVTKDIDNYSWIKIPKLMFDEIKAFSTSEPCEIEISYRNRATGDKIVLKRNAQNIEDDSSVDSFCKYSQKFKTMIETPEKLKELYNEIEKINFNPSCLLFPDWIELIKEVKTFSEMQKDKDYAMAQQQYSAGVTRTFSSQVRSVGICTPKKS
jgi:hypothetical protein